MTRTRFPLRANRSCNMFLGVMCAGSRRRALNFNPIVKNTNMDIISDRIIPVQNRVGDHLMQSFGGIGDRFKAPGPRNLDFTDDFLGNRDGLLYEVIRAALNADRVSNEGLASSFGVTGLIWIDFYLATLGKNCLGQICEENYSANGWLVIFDEFLLP
jgi:hypothetical protein